MFALLTIRLRTKDDDRGASMVEYAFLLILIAMIAFVAVGYAGAEVSTSYSEIADGLSGV
jgi:pilus assembly protein Flp/PilA